MLNVSVWFKVDSIPIPAYCFTVPILIMIHEASTSLLHYSTDSYSYTDANLSTRQLCNYHTISSFALPLRWWYSQSVQSLSSPIKLFTLVNHSISLLQQWNNGTSFRNLYNSPLADRRPFFVTVGKYHTSISGHDVGDVSCLTDFPTCPLYHSITFIAIKTLH